MPLFGKTPRNPVIEQKVGWPVGSHSADTELLIKLRGKYDKLFICFSWSRELMQHEFSIGISRFGSINLTMSFLSMYPISLARPCSCCSTPWCQNKTGGRDSIRDTPASVTRPSGRGNPRLLGLLVSTLLYNFILVSVGRKQAVNYQRFHPTFS